VFEMLHLNLFGGFTLRSSDGRKIDIDLAKSRALLCYLALNAGRNIDRVQLASLLWGTQSESRARHSLTQALSTLSRALEDDANCLERRREHVCFHKDCLDVDLLRLMTIDDAVDPYRLVEIINHFEPDVLSEFSFGEPDFDEWALMTREDGHERVLRAGMRYLSLDETARDIESSVQVARKLLRIDPFFEPAHRTLIRDYLACDDIGAAQKQAKTCREVLRNELGVEPGPETQRLIEKIRGPRSPNLMFQAPTSTFDKSPETPSIVVLALQNLTGDSSLHHICQGLSDDITTELVRYRSLFVISRESAFQMTAAPENIGDICRRLGVRHALCGSLRPHRGRFRINFRLVDGASGQSVWSERYDSDRAEILAISDDVTCNLVSRLATSLEEDALARARRKPPAEWTAYDHLLQGLVYHHRSWYGKGMLLGAVKHFTRAVELDPELARAHAYLACAISAPWYKDREIEHLDRCMEHATRAVEIDPFEAEAQRIMGGVHLVRSDHELAEHHFDLALQSHPGNAHVLAHAAKYHAYVGANADAVSLVNKARQLNPLHPAWYWQHLGVAKFGQQDYRQSIRTFSRLPFLVFFDRLYLAAAHAHLGDRVAAGRHLEIALRDKPELNRDTITRFLPYSSAEDLKNVIVGLKIAGLA